MKDFKPTIKPATEQGRKIEKGFSQYVNEIDSTLSEDEKKKKKAIFNLAKMETLVHNDPDLSELYNEMVERDKEMYGYHYNEAIMNIIFNTKVLKSPKYLKKYSQTPAKKKSRRDKYGIEDLKTPETKKREEKEETNETTTSASSGSYSTPRAWSNTGKPEMRKPMWIGGTVLSESNYLIDPKIFGDIKNYINEIYETKDYIYEHHLSSKEEKISFIITNSPDKYSDIEKLDNMSDEEIDRIYNEVEGEMGINEENKLEIYEHHLDNKDDKIQFIINNAGDKYGDTNLLNGLNDNAIDALYKSLERELGITENLDERAKSKSQQKFMGMVRGLQKGEINPKDVSDKVKKVAKEMKPSDVKDFAATKHDELPEKVEEISIVEPSTKTMAMSSDKENSMKMKKPLTTSSISGISEKLEIMKKDLEYLNSISEDRKHPAMVQLDRLKSQNKTNFNNELNKIDDIEMAKDQYTEVGENPQKLSQDLEKESLKKTDGEALKNVGNSANEKGDEITKRNLTDDEVEEIEMIRDGMHTIKYDTQPDKKFEERMETGMGEHLYDVRQKKLDMQANMPMYNKDTQPVQDGDKKNQYNKFAKKMNESVFSGRYVNKFNQRKFVDFKMNDVIELENINESCLSLNVEGMGNLFDNKVQVNENAINFFEKHKFYYDTNTNKVVIVKKQKQSLNESKTNVVDNKKIEQMKKLFNYNPSNFIDTRTSRNAIK